MISRLDLGAGQKAEVVAGGGGGLISRRLLIDGWRVEAVAL